MATRWKHEKTEILYSMHAHNQRSRWYDCLESAALDMGLPIAFREFSNHYDGSCDREWLVSTPWLKRLGGRAELERRAREMHNAWFDSRYGKELF